MATVLLSDAEKLFLLHGVEENIRNDGRSALDCRSFSLECDIVTSASGSSRLRLGSTDILVGVKAELDTPDPCKPDQGFIDFYIDCSALASPRFEGREGKELGTEIKNILKSVYVEGSAVINLNKLCIVDGKHCWRLKVDVVILDCTGGSLYDAISLAIKAALFNTKVPVAEYDDESNDVEVVGDIYQYLLLDFNLCPLLVTVSKIGQGHIVDSTLEEEACSSAQIVVGVNAQGLLSGPQKLANQSICVSTLCDMLKTAQLVGVQLNRRLMQQLSKLHQVLDVNAIAPSGDHALLNGNSVSR